jgi:hypothetical protein
LEDVSVVAVILIGLWVFFVTSRRNRNHTSPADRPLPETAPAHSLSSEITWNFNLESSDSSGIDQGDRWVLGQVRPADPYPIKSL